MKEAVKQSAANITDAGVMSGKIDVAPCFPGVGLRAPAPDGPRGEGEGLVTAYVSPTSAQLGRRSVIRKRWTR